MISVVICSVNKALAAQVKRNIDTTIGVDWELKLMDNTVLKKGITAVYNLAAAECKFDFICFVHEDVLFTTPAWGRNILDIFRQDPQLGLIGVAGSRYKSKVCSGWTSGIGHFDCCNILHRDPSGKEQRIYMNPDPSQNLQETVTVDGVFMFCRKTVWERIKFDQEQLRGFHLYDIDFSFRVSLNYKVAVTYLVSLIHLTQGGDYGNAWIEETMQWHQRNKPRLPLLKGSVMAINGEPEIVVAKTWLDRLKTEPISFRNKLQWIAENRLFLRPALYPQIILFFLFRYYRRLKK